MNHLGIDLGKRTGRAVLKDDKGKILDEFLFLITKEMEIHDLLSRMQSHGKCIGVLESTGNMLMKSHDTLEENGIDTKLANPYKTRIIAEAKIKLDKLDTRILSDLLTTDLIYESYVPKQEDRDRSLVRHRLTLSRTKTKLANKVHSILDKYDYQTDLTDIFSKSGIEWLKSLTPLVTPVDRITLDSSIVSIEANNQQIDTVSKEISKYASCDGKDVKILLSKTGIDIFSAMLISTEIVDVRWFSTTWKLVSYAGLDPCTR